MTLVPISSYDEWWHLATGEYILSTRAVPVRDVFSFTAAGNRWVTHEWLFEVAIAAGYRLGRIPAVLLIRTLIVLTGLLLTVATLRRLHVDRIIAAPLLVLASFMVTFRSFARPHVATEALLAGYLLALLAVQRSAAPARNMRRLWLLLPLQIVWANLHAGAVFGPLLVALFALGEGTQAVLARRWPRQWSAAFSVPQAGMLLLLSLALTGASLANPSTWRVLHYPIFLAGNRTFTGAITELQSPVLPDYRGSDFFVSLVILVVTGIASLVMARRRSLSGSLVFAAFGTAALLAVRNIPLFGLAAVPFVGDWFQSRLPRLTPVRRRILQVMIASTIAAVLALVVTRGVRLPGGTRRPMFGVEAGRFPVGAAQFIRNHISGNTLNTMEFGGYLIWRWFPERRVFCDGRLDVYGPEFFEQYRRALWSGPQFDTIVTRYSITNCILAWPPDLEERTEKYLGRTLALRPDWRLVYWDDVALVYVCRDSANIALAESLGYRALLPMLLWPGGTDSVPAGQTLAEAQRAVDMSPGSARAHAVLGSALLLSGRTAEATAEFSTARRIVPSYLPAIQGEAMSAAASGDRDAATRALSELVRRAPRDPLAWYNLGLALLGSGDARRARKSFSSALRLKPDFVPAHNGIAEAFLAEGNAAKAREHTETVLRLDPANPHARARLRRLP